MIRFLHHQILHHPVLPKQYKSEICAIDRKHYSKTAHVLRFWLDFDRLIIGAGSAGLVATKRAATWMKVAIAEQDHLGGGCVLFVRRPPIGLPKRQLFSVVLKLLVFSLILLIL
ncbi:hypothetical protein [Leptolyngbya sp. FACHB-711]|uniref:hypothetical protein n=1 Tax=unclassified Leptolyngbya TaxID=2650499 RepID=UPI0016893F7B|nr:hypothetical protein [Leptolyngbya sp. FACHB-711]MBD1849392.1 hypothetical protein [Cyanobacteria bacterium FACHB-502]MBD2023223.1 hypothetical protein [Leptolyngbya sp. FACHB-711]